MSIQTNIQEVRQRIAAACGECGRDPKEITLVGASKMNDAAACLSLLKKGRIGAALGGLRDQLSPRVCEALRRRGDPKPFRVYLKNALKRGRHA